MSQQKKCRAGYRKSKTGKSCVKTVKLKAPCSLKQISKEWKKLSPPTRKSYAKKGEKTAWNAFIKEKRKKCPTKK